MNIESKKNALKITGFLFLAILFSTNYYGGNSLFFLGDKALFVLRVFFGTGGIVLLILYFALSNKEKRELIEYNGHFYTGEAIRKMESCGVSKENIESAIKNGIKKEGRLSTFYSFGTKDGRDFTVVLNNKGYIVDVSI